MTGKDQDNLPTSSTDEGVDIEAFVEEDDAVQKENTSADEEVNESASLFEEAEAEQQPTKAGIPDAKTKRGYTKLELILVALLAIAMVVIVRQAGTPQAGANLPSGHPDISNMTQGGFSMGDGKDGNDPHATPELNENKIAELKKAVEANDKAIEPRLELGKLYFDAKHYQDASLYFEQALKLSPDDMEILLISGVTAFNINDFATAEKHWKKATEVDPKQPEPWYNLGYVYLMQKPVNEADLKLVWDKVLELAPESDMAKDVAKYREQAPGPVSESTK